MRFSIYLNAQTRGPHEDVPIVETLTRQALEATSAGFHGIALTEHHFSGYNTYGDNFMFAAHLAGQAPRGTKFSLAVAVPPLHNPMRLAQKCNLLDVLTRGELIVGFAAGGSPVEYAGMGRDPGERHAEMFHNLEILEAALAKTPEDPPLKWHTTFEEGVLHTRIMPAGFHRAHPPFARATQSDSGAEWTGRRAWYLFTAREKPAAIADRWRVYEQSLRDSGADEATVADRLEWSMVQKQVYLAETTEQAERDIRDRLTLMAEHQRRSFGVVSGLRDAKHMRSVVGVSPQNPEEFLDHAMIIGDPETVRDRIREYEAAGVQHMAFLFNYGFMSAETADRSLRLFIDEVLPSFAERT
ncbi:LLM class flavin-dependent oxidoreductase [Actinocrispum wychmicini]|uniref:Alkanesulfonate monooxygenase SsuD/methylene tetrahydromethanopterin reductase-like flavin-dependent oxidoreductase (Luciferase family) n=1 Tax=Actinocrispum wychmicini TaxID=1213861 RepID=A0A4R2JZ88_9PSEU|nr:LLM class flavin-dependent oxidoreductase [Actinocrispum wychmicini]TCO62758.1 alkanesulfonate monooxygenase SsuD/methylene tetrahydromethanopterin reductase-like flavin-dependent oxidoreductase (luciferase family) [Actinocrispum wychmicini]